MGANKRTAQIRRQKKQEAKRHRAPRLDLNSLVRPSTSVEARVQRGTGPNTGRGLDGTLRYALLLAYNGRCDEALKLCDAAARRYPAQGRVVQTRADVLMLSGDLSAQVWRGGLSGLRTKEPIRQPRWTGDPLPGQTILLWDDYDHGRGLGDAIQLARMIPLVKASSQARVMVSAPLGMGRLFSCLPGADAIVEPPLPTEGFDVQVPFSILPGIPGCELTAERLSTVPYLFAEEEAVQRWAPMFADRSLVHVGLHWGADPRHMEPEQLRSLSAATLAPLFDVWGARFYSLQYDGGAELKDYPHVVDLGNIDNAAERFVETAAVVTHLDLLIACDSGPAHVAGALGVKVWLLLNNAYDCRWGLNQKTVWYPGHTLMTQGASGDWNELVWNVRERLERLVYHHAEDRKEAAKHIM